VDELEAAINGLFQYIQTQGNNLGRQEQEMLMQVLGELNEVVNPRIEAEIPTSVGLLWHISGGNAGVFRDYMRQVPDPSLNALANNPTQLSYIIQRLEQNQPQERNREIDGIPQAPIQSSNVWGFAYDQPNRKLYVRFQGDGVYEYEGVPPQIFKLFQQGAIPAKTNGENQYGQWWEGKTPSLGASLHELIKTKGYPYQKVA
jgi:hypothetical protein